VASPAAAWGQDTAQGRVVVAQSFGSPLHREESLLCSVIPMLQSCTTFTMLGHVLPGPHLHASPSAHPPTSPPERQPTAPPPYRPAPPLAPYMCVCVCVCARVCRVVDLGPFKHTIDDGLELRKAAFECMDVLLERCADRVEPDAFIQHLMGGLKVRCARRGGWGVGWGGGGGGGAPRVGGSGEGASGQHLMHGWVGSGCPVGVGWQRAFLQHRCGRGQGRALTQQCLGRLEVRAGSRGEDSNFGGGGGGDCGCPGGVCWRLCSATSCYALL
jgi:hypothetical protein